MKKIYLNYLFVFLLILFSIGSINGEDINPISSPTDSNTDPIISNEIQDSISPQILANDTELYYKDGTKLIATLFHNENKPLENEELIIEINNQTYYRYANQSGSIFLTINLNPGVYETIISSNNYNITTTVYITVLPTLIGNDLTKYYKNDSQYYVTLLDKNGNPEVGSNVTMNINGVVYNRLTDENGTAKLSINLAPNSYVITVTNNFNGEKLSNKIIVLSTIINNNDLIKHYRNDSQYYATILDYMGNPLVNTEVSMNINGVLYKKTTNESGVVRLNINLGEGIYVITVLHPLSGFEASNTIEVLPIILSDDLMMLFQERSFDITVLDDNGKPLANTLVTFNIYGVFYERVSNSLGIATLNLNLVPGEYIITTSYNEFSTSNIIKIFSSYNSILYASDMFTTLGENRDYLVQLRNFYGNPISNGVVNVFIDKYEVNYYLSAQEWDYRFSDSFGFILATNNEGFASFKADFSQGHYVIRFSYSGDNEHFGADDLVRTITVVGINGESGRGNSVYNGGSLYQFLQPSSGVESSNSIIIDLARDITSGHTTVTEKANAIFNFVAGNIEYELYSGTKYGALRTLQLGKGNCVDQAHLIVALARAADIPARHIQGPNHVWAQILIEEQNIWLIADTTTQRCSHFGYWNIYPSNSGAFA